MLPHLRNNLHQETIHKRRPNFFDNLFPCMSTIFSYFNPLANFKEILNPPILNWRRRLWTAPPQVVDLNLEMGEEREGGSKVESEKNSFNAARSVVDTPR